MSTAYSISVNSGSASDTFNIGKTLGTNLKGGEIIELVSDLGSGKTVLVKGLVLGAGSNELVSSPSFTICNEYSSPKFNIYHFDFYRLNDPGIIKRELAEAVDSGKNVTVIEWPDVIENILPARKVTIRIEPKSENSRVINITCYPELAYLTKDLK